MARPPARPMIPAVQSKPPGAGSPTSTTTGRTNGSRASAVRWSGATAPVICDCDAAFSPRASEMELSDARRGVLPPVVRRTALNVPIGDGGRRHGADRGDGQRGGEGAARLGEHDGSCVDPADPMRPMPETLRRAGVRAVTARSRSGNGAGSVGRRRAMDYRILGPLELVDGSAPVQLAGGRQRALLALLLIHRNEVVPSERLIDALWGERPPPTAPKALQNAVVQIRRALGDDAAALRTEHGGYVLHVARRRARRRPLRGAGGSRARSARRGRSGRRGRAAPRGARPLARPAVRRPRLRAVRAAGDRAARGGAPGRARGPDRGRPRARPPRRARPGARGGGRPPPAARAAARPADDRAVRQRPPGRRARGLPRCPPRARSTSSASSPVRRCASATTRSCARTPRSTRRREPGRGRPPLRARGSRCSPAPPLCCCSRPPRRRRRSP